ncbi:hypothetical protein BLNAU_15690 [Blattamonas nauphoetae]|uniref:Protein kinase domain-containing protein n=1 Tax=Blattamonas nauphoetae TaxID=2049346 RepID=A0ABQ9XDC0_9EUKA|nr:hypothetical protein BLNAU_15690 [Blattamonas nauphoetae]
MAMRSSVCLFFHYIVLVSTYFLSDPLFIVEGGFGETYSDDMSLTEFEMPQLYVSPERLDSESGEATCEGDVWSLGVVLYWLLFGEPPFKKNNMVQLIRDIPSFKAVNIPNSCGEEERALLMRMMDPCAESRITCRQLRLSKSFQCIVNTIEGVWKLKNDEQTQRVEAEDNKWKAEAERGRMEEEKKKAESERRKMEEEKQKAEEKARKAEEAKKKADAERTRMEEEKKKAETERRKMEEEKRKTEIESRKIEEEKRRAEWKLKTIEEQKQQAEREKEELSNEVKRTLQELEDAREAKEKIEREMHSLKTWYDDLKLQLSNFPAYVGTESLTTIDRTVHKLTPNSITQIIKQKTGDWRTAYSLPIDEGEWELKIREHDTLWHVTLGYLRHPLPENATQQQCGTYFGGIGGHFVLWKGGMRHAGKEFKPAGTNKKCDEVGQTAAIRVNMSTREARLFLDDEEQPGIFTDIPSPLCLGITTQNQNTRIEVIYFATTDGSKTEHAKWALSMSTRIKALEAENLKLEDTMDRMRIMLRTEWDGTESLHSVDGTAHQISPTTLTQVIKLEKTNEWRTAFTFPVEEGEWELKIRGNDTVWNVMLGFLKHPLPERSTHTQCGSYFDGIGGDFLLYSGGMWQGGEFKPAGTNKKCDRVGQTAAIRVDMSTREARLFVDDDEQPGIFTDIG